MADGMYTVTNQRERALRCQRGEPDAVRADSQNRLGTALAAATTETSRAHERTVAIGFVGSDGPGVAFAAALGAREQVSRLRNMLYLDTLEAEAVAGLLAEATTRAAGAAAASSGPPKRISTSDADRRTPVVDGGDR
jgi:hypothetical protein